MKRTRSGQRIIRELHTNTYDEAAGHIVLNEAQIYAVDELNTHYTRMFTDATYPDRMDPQNQVSGEDNLRAVTAFFFWGGWVSAANRPGETYSYTHNWPYRSGGRQHRHQRHVHLDLCFDLRAVDRDQRGPVRLRPDEGAAG